MTQPTLLTRLQARFETDIDPDELQRILDEANLEVVRRFGPHADPANPITIQFQGGSQTLDMLRPIAMNADGTPVSDLVVTEFWRSLPFGDPQQTVLTDADYRIWFDGRTLERIYSGPNNWGSIAWGRDPDPASRFGWGGSAGWVTVTYVPVNDGDQREEVILKLAILDLLYNPKVQERVGREIDEQPTVYSEERERLLAMLQPRRGLLLR